MVSFAKSIQNASSETAAADRPKAAQPAIRTVGRADLIDAVRLGLADFRAAPTHVVFLSLIYPVVGLLLARLTFSYDVLPLLFPAIAGFAILGPFSAVGLYQISKLREQGQPVTWRSTLAVVQGRSAASILALGGLLAGLFVVWMFAAGALYDASFGDETPQSLSTLIDQVVGTPAGWRMMLVGDAVGALFAAIAFATSVVSFPLLVDRDSDAMTAVLTSVRAVVANPVAMIEWAVFVVAALVVGALPMLMGLALVMPVLGHATWHLYRKVVV